MGFETLLLLCDVLRRLWAACVCAVLAHLQGVGTGADPGKGFSVISSETWAWLQGEDFFVKLSYNQILFSRAGGGGRLACFLLILL